MGPNTPKPAKLSIGELMAADIQSLSPEDRKRKIEQENAMLREDAMRGMLVPMEVGPDGVNMVYMSPDVFARPSQITEGQRAAGVRPVLPQDVYQAVANQMPLRGMPVAPQRVVPANLPQQLAVLPAAAGGSQLVGDMGYNAQIDRAMQARRPSPQQQAAYEKAMRDLLMSSLVK